MDTTFSLHNLGAESQPQMHTHTILQPFHGSSNLAVQMDHHRQAGESASFQQHHHNVPRPSHNHLSSFAMSAGVDVADFPTGELHGFSGFNASPTSLLANGQQSLSLPQGRNDITVQSLGRGGLPQKRLAEHQEPVHSEPGRYAPSVLTGAADPSVGSLVLVEPPSQEIQPSGVLDNGSTGDQGKQNGRPGSGGSSRLPPTKLVENPPDLAKWRQKLFDLENTMILTQDEYETYFPWVDNVYSHRSTQRYKRKPFVTHYWDCRLKGKPPGTAKSDDPNKKKRKRVARKRDQCDVKIKITEYLAGASLDHQAQPNNKDAPFVVGADGTSLGDLMARVQGKPFWTIQRINGSVASGAGGDSKAETHRHNLEMSDEIKKNSVLRWIAAREKEAKKSTKPSRWRATGDAAITVKHHTGESRIKFFASCFCPFSQRVWIALEAKGLDYQYCEIDPVRTPKPTHLLEANSRGLVPAIREGDWACGESSVILEYLEDLDRSVLLFPTDARLKANCRVWIDFINTRVVPSFHALLTVSNEEMPQAREKLWADLGLLVQAADEKGPYFLGQEMCSVDIHLAPFALWLPRLPERFGVEGDRAAMKEKEKEYRRWKEWLSAMGENPHVRKTTSREGLYKESVDVVIEGCRDHLE